MEEIAADTAVKGGEDMVQKRGPVGRAVWMAVCGAVLLSVALVMFILRYRALEEELDRMLMESLAAHTTLDGNNTGELIDGLSAVLDNVGQLISDSGRQPEKMWVESLLKTAVLAGRQAEMGYLEAGEVAQIPEESGEHASLREALSGRAAVSGLIFAPDRSEAYILVTRPVELNGQTVGVLLARLDAGQLSQPENHSTFFHDVHSVIAGADGTVVYESVTKSNGISLGELGEQNGLFGRDAQQFIEAYQNSESGSFCYDPPGGRCYVAWAPVHCNDWRVVQFSQSINIQVERTSALQTAIMLLSLAVCGILAVLIWRQRVRLAGEKLRYGVLAEFCDTLIFEYDRERDSLEFTSNALDSLDLEQVRLEGVTKRSGGLSVFHPDDAETVRRVLSTVNEMTPEQVDHDRVRLKQRDGSYNWYRSQYKAVCGPDGRVTQIIGTLTDISAQIVREAELRKQAQQDPLTGVYNRAGVELINARLEQISRGVLFMLDLDDFKSINDNFGHAAGDKLLMAVGHILNETFRTDDIVARVGGDEFVVFLSGSDNIKLAEQKGQELLDRVRELRIEGIDAVASVSVGAARAPAHGRNYGALSVVADKALYQVKNGGKGGFALL